MKIYPTSSNVKIIGICLQIFRTYYKKQPVCQIGIRCGKIDYKKELQLNLFEEAEKTIFSEDLEMVVDRIREKYGFSSLVHASSLTKGGTANQKSGLGGTKDSKRYERITTRTGYLRNYKSIYGDYQKAL